MEPIKAFGERRATLATQVHLALFGGFEVRGPGGSVPLPTRKAEALLAVLACRLGETQLRERLIALLWGDRSDRQARHSLSQTLSSLRRALDVTPLFITEGDAVALCPKNVEVDVVEFRRLVDSDSVADLSKAADLYRGPVLEGFKLRDPGFEEWLTQERAQLHGRAVDVLVSLAQHQAAGGNSDLAVAALRRALALDPLAEEVHRRLIRLHLDQGACNAAIRHYRHCCDVLKRELGTAPEPSTIALYHEALLATRAAQACDSQSTAAAREGPQQPEDDASLEGWDHRPSIAVLPLVNMSGASDQSYFSDGITEDIITELSRFHELFVVARNSSFRYRRSDDTKQIAEELGVRFIVEGSVRRAGGRIRIAVQLVEAMTGAHLWAERFDRDIGDVFAVQDEVVQIIVSKIAGQLELAEERRARRKRAENLAAYDCYLRGLAYVHSDEREDQAKARAWFEKAVALDAGYAAPLAMLAMVAAIEGFYGKSDDHLDRALKLANEAIALDPNDSWAHCALGYINLKHKSHDLSMHYFAKAIRLNPNEPDHLAFCALHHASTGRPDLALQLMDRAESLNPCVPPWYLAHRGYALYALQRYGEAAQSFERQMPRPYWDTCFLAACYTQLERQVEARACVAEALGEMPDLSLSTLAGRIADMGLPDLDRILTRLGQAGLPAAVAKTP